MNPDVSPPPPTPVSPPARWEQPPAPDFSGLTTSDDTPVDSIFSERQMRLLVEPLYATWQHRVGGRQFLALANVGLFGSPEEPPLVPDVLVSLDVSAPAQVVDPKRKDHHSYFVWKYGKPPNVVVEIVSNREGGEADRKLAGYARLGVAYYVIFDPEHHLQNEAVRAFVLHGNRYEPLPAPPVRLAGTGLGLTLWPGRFEDCTATWLRWVDDQGGLIQSGAERADAETARADAERDRADAERARADAERTRADELAARLRALEGGRRDSRTEGA